jgi:hypothetical protein
MRNVFITGLGSLLLSGLLVTQSWAGAFKSNLVCRVSIPPPPMPIIAKKGQVSITANGDVKGSMQLRDPLTSAVSLDCEILCEGTPSAGPMPCVEAQAGDSTLLIDAPGLGTALSLCVEPAVAVGPCISAYIPPRP